MKVGWCRCGKGVFPSMDSYRNFFSIIKHDEKQEKKTDFIFSEKMSVGMSSLDDGYLIHVSFSDH